MMFVGTQHPKEQKESNTRKRKSQDTATNNVCICRLTHQILLEDEREHCVLCLVLTTIFLSVSLFSPSLVTMSIISTECCSQSEQMDTKC